MSKHCAYALYQRQHASTRQASACAQTHSSSKRKSTASCLVQLKAYERDMARQAAAATELFKMLCAKRPSLLPRYCDVYLEEGQDTDIKVHA